MNHKAEPLSGISCGGKRYVVFSHGFGVRKDGGGGGIFTDIVKSLGTGYEAVMFDYNDVSEDGSTMRVRPFSVQAKRLNDEIRKLRREHPDAVIDLVAHSQGCVVAALACPEDVRKAVFLAPSFVADTGRVIARYEGKPGAVIDPKGESRFPRTDGTVSIIPAEYWRERMVLDFPTLYAAFAAKTDLHMIRAQDDEVLGSEELPCIPEGVDVLFIPGTHDFTGTSRSGMVQVVTDMLS